MKRKVSELPEGFELMYSESKRLIRLFGQEGDRLQNLLGSQIKVYSQENKMCDGGRNIEINKHTLCYQYSMPVLKSATDSQMSIGIYNLRIDENGKFLNAAGLPESFPIDKHQLAYKQYELYAMSGKLVWSELNGEPGEFLSEELVSNWSTALMKYIVPNTGLSI